MAHITHYLPELDDPERSFIAQLTAAMSDAQVLQFASAYRQARKDPQTILLMAVIGVVAVPGLHRFWLGQVGIGFLYLLTWGLLLIGTITDVVKHRELAFRYNRQVAARIANNLVQSGNAYLGARTGGWAKSSFACARTPSSLNKMDDDTSIWQNSARFSSQRFGRTTTLTANSPSFRLNSSRPARCRNQSALMTA